MILNGKIALITGGARMGSALAGALGEKGCGVAVAYRGSRDSAEVAAGEAQRAGVPAGVFQAELSRVSEARRLIQAVVKKFGRLDILINLVSRYKQDPFQGLMRSPVMAEKAWREQLGCDLDVAWRLSLAAAPALKNTGGGRIVHVSDWLAASARPRYKGYLPYYVSKAGVKALTEALALELAPEVLVNAIAPGPILPPREMTARQKHEVVEATPLKRWGGPGELARAVIFLVESDFVTGETLRVDGGRHLL